MPVFDFSSIYETFDRWFRESENNISTTISIFSKSRIWLEFSMIISIHWIVNMNHTEIGNFDCIFELQQNNLQMEYPFVLNIIWCCYFLSQSLIYFQKIIWGSWMHTALATPHNLIGCNTNFDWLVSKVNTS